MYFYVEIAMEIPDFGLFFVLLYENFFFACNKIKNIIFPLILYNKMVICEDSLTNLLISKFELGVSSDRELPRLLQKNCAWCNQRK